MLSGSPKDDLVAVRLYPSAIRQHDLDPAAVVCHPPDGVDGLAGMLIGPILAGASAIGPEDPTEIH